MKLWLDDERDPVNPFIKKQFVANGDELWVKTAEEAIKQLETGTVDFISFDHDLGLGKTGYDVAKYIEEAAFFNKIPRLQWRVHSANPTGSLNISLAMRQADKYWDKNEAI